MITKDIIKKDLKNKCLGINLKKYTHNIMYRVFCLKKYETEIKTYLENLGFRNIISYGGGGFQLKHNAELVIKGIIDKGGINE